MLIYYQDSIVEKLLTTTALLHSVKSMSTRENTTPINQKSRKIGSTKGKKCHHSSQNVIHGHLVVPIYCYSSLDTREEKTKPLLSKKKQRGFLQCFVSISGSVSRILSSMLPCVVKVCQSEAL